MVSLDESLFWLINGRHEPVLDRVMWLVTQLGNAWVVGPLLLVMVILAFRNGQLKRILMFGITAMICSGLINASIKQIVRRPRPLKHFSRTAGHSDREVHIVGERLKYRSFPSGHTNTAFTAATLLVILFGIRLWPLYIAAGLVGYTRIYMGVHFPADVIAGGLLGTAAVWLTAYIFKRKKILVTEPQ